MTSASLLTDKEVLLPLAQALRDLADTPEMVKRADRITRHNRLDSPEPLVFVFPEGSWEEIFPSASLECSDPFARVLERQLRERLFMAQAVKDDSVVHPWVTIDRAVEDSGYGIESPKQQGEHRGSYVWDPPIKDIASFASSVRPREVSHRAGLTESRAALATELVGEALDVRIQCQPWWTMGMTWKVIDLVGMENLMLAMMDDPDSVHAMMAWMRDEHLAYLDQMETLGVLTGNSEGEYCGSGGYGFSDELRPPQEGPVPLMERWGFAESQETVGISPAMFEEFVLQYQIPILARFGLNHYGCCEPLDARWRYVKQIPRLRRVSVSPWCSEEAIAPQLAGDYVYSRKPNPAPLSVGFNEAALTESLDRTLTVARGCVLEIVMKDTHTCEHDSSRFGRWVDIARRRIDLFWR
jgi:hypothetical protein